MAACKDHAIDDGYICVQVRKADGTPLCPTLADLRLHAAAPDLYACLADIWKTCRCGGDIDGDTDWVAVKAAVEKAVGK